MGGVFARCKGTSTGDRPVVDQSTNQAKRKATKGEEKSPSEERTLGNEKPENDLYFISLAESLTSFRHQALFVDFTVKVGTSHFPVHKNVLAASCKFFRDLFNASEDVCYEINNVGPKAVEEVLDFLYTGKCRLDQQNAASVLCVSEILGIRDLKEALERHLSLAKGASQCGTMTAQEEIKICRKESNLTAIREFQVGGLFCDVTLTTSCGRVVPAHKNILAAVSCYFQGLFRSDMKEVHENNVDFAIIDESVVNELLHFIYSGQIWVTFNNIKSLLQACDYLLLESLKQTIDKFLKRSLTGPNFWQFFALVKFFYGLEEILLMTCINYWELTKSNEFLEITEEDMKFFLLNDDIVCSEAQMLESLIRWYKYSKQQREESFKNLLHLIHMSSIPDVYLKFLAETEAITELRSYTGHQLRKKVSLHEMKRIAHFYNLVLFGFTRDPDRSGNQICYWLPFAGPWSYITYLNRPPVHWCGGHPCIFHDNALFMQVYPQVQLAFFSNPFSAKHFESSCLEPVTFTESLPTKKEECTAVVLASCIYLIGGNVLNEVQNTVHRYNTVTQSWECVSSMRERRCYHCAVSYRDRYIYVFGGTDAVIGTDNRILKSTVERYDPEQNSWSYVASMHQPRCNGQACVLTHKIFVMGGECVSAAGQM